MMPTVPKQRRVEWQAVRETIDLVRVATDRLGTPAKQSGRKLYWLCPVHDDTHPSFFVDAERQRWRCYPCGRSGDALDLVRLLNPGMSFPAAVAELTGAAAVAARSPAGLRRAPKPPDRDRDRHRGMPEADALQLVADAERTLWAPDGASALAELRDRKQGRGLTDETIRAARLGWTHGARGVPWQSPGIVIPWFNRGELAQVKVRPPDVWRARFPEKSRPPKYIEAFCRPVRRVCYPGPDAVAPGEPLIVNEGEFDALLLGQELAGLAGVVTLGSAANRPDAEAMYAFMTADEPWFIATDADPAGDWPSNTSRVRPASLRPHPEDQVEKPKTDWTDLHQHGVNLRRWWSEVLAGNESPPLFTWEELAALRWGPADVDQLEHLGGPQ